MDHEVLLEHFAIDPTCIDHYSLHLDSFRVD